MNGLQHQDPTSHMSELDRFGIAGLLAALQGPSTDQMELASGMDLNLLGLDLSQSEFVDRGFVLMRSC